MKKIIFILLGIGILVGAFFIFPRQVSISRGDTSVPAKSPLAQQPDPLLEVPESTSTPPAPPKDGADIEKQRPLANPPSEVRGIYMTAWIAGIPSRVDSLIKLAKEKDINAVVVDVKDYSGYVSYATGNPAISQSGAEKEIRILHPNKLIKKLHDNGLYAIARITIFQDSVLAKSHPEWALKSVKTGGLWKDNKGLAWMDAASRDVWDYNIAIAKDAQSRGFDEINFDYVRFPSDGSLKSVVYPVWDGKEERAETIRRFFSYVREKMGSAVLSADLFGISTVNPDDLGIGQIIENAYPYFDYVCPMTYPSHYAAGFMNFKKPATHPYEVLKYSMENARLRLEGKKSSAGEPRGNPQLFRAKLRPWLQVFDLGATYTREMVDLQVKGVKDALGSSSAYAGYLYWDPKNTYTTL